MIQAVQKNFKAVRTSKLDGKHYDCIIIGAGMSGLASGIRLKLAGKNTLILERHNASGGLNSFYSIDGHKYDVGLHAFTNYVPKGTKGAPLTKLLRQLRIPYEALDLSPQLRSKIHFPECSLIFTNEFNYLNQQIEQEFPHCIDGFNRLVKLIRDYDAFNLKSKPLSAKETLKVYIKDPLLTSMLLCPIMFYGSSSENDMDFTQFVIMFRSLFLEGFARPLNGVRTIIKSLQDKYRELGGIRKMRCGVDQICSDGELVTEIRLDDGSVVTSDSIISTAGYYETMDLCKPLNKKILEKPNYGQLTFTETITLIDSMPKELGWNDTIIFFNKSNAFSYAPPKNELACLNSGVICFPNNYEYPNNENLDYGVLRITSLAHNKNWFKLSDTNYKQEKIEWYNKLLKNTLEILPGKQESLSSFNKRTIAKDMFTPKTIKKFTGHKNGAIYGCPKKIRDGRTHLKNLFIAGTDQGFLGIVGAILSGISISNKYCLKKD